MGVYNVRVEGVLVANRGAEGGMGGKLINDEGPLLGKGKYWQLWGDKLHGKLCNPEGSLRLCEPQGVENVIMSQDMLVRI